MVSTGRNKKRSTKMEIYKYSTMDLVGKKIFEYGKAGTAAIIEIVPDYSPAPSVGSKFTNKDGETRTITTNRVVESQARQMLLKNHIITGGVFCLESEIADVVTNAGYTEVNVSEIVNERRKMAEKIGLQLTNEQLKNMTVDQMVDMALSSGNIKIGNSDEKKPVTVANHPGATEEALAIMKANGIELSSLIHEFPNLITAEDLNSKGWELPETQEGEETAKVEKLPKITAKAQELCEENNISDIAAIPHSGERITPADVKKYLKSI